MEQSLTDVIKASTFSVIEGTYVYAKVATVPIIENHFIVTKDADEITVVTKVENLKELDLIERNKEDYALIALNVSVPFYSVGFLAVVSNAIAEAGMNILIVSTYSKDYILVKEENSEKAKNVLIKLGFSEANK